MNLETVDKVDYNDDIPEAHVVEEAYVVKTVAKVLNRKSLFSEKCIEKKEEKTNKLAKEKEKFRKEEETRIKTRQILEEKRQNKYKENYEKLIDLDNHVGKILNFVENNVEKGYERITYDIDVDKDIHDINKDVLDKLYNKISIVLYNTHGIFSYNWDYKVTNHNKVGFRNVYHYQKTRNFSSRNFSSSLIWSKNVKINTIYPTREYENFFTFEETWEKIWPYGKNSLYGGLTKPTTKKEADKNMERYLCSRGYK